MNSQVWTEIVDVARHCASVHNVQPWKVKIFSDKEAHLYYDTARLIPDTDPTSCLVVISMSMFIECLSIASNNLGYKVVAEFEQEQILTISGDKLKLFAKLRLVETPKKKVSNRELIIQRKTSRLHYNGKAVSKNELESFSDLVSKNDYFFSYTNEKKIIEKIIQLNTKTMFVDANNYKALKEFRIWMRTTKKEAEQKKDGLWSQCLGISGVALNCLTRYPKIFTGILFKKITSIAYTNTLKGTATIGWFSGKFENRNDWTKAGITLQRFWLETTRHNCYLHPIMSIVVNPSILENFKLTVSHDEAKGKVWFIARLGYSKEPTKSYRLETKDIIIQ